jgi:hypothetical protein
LCLQKNWLNPWRVIRLARDKLLPGKGKQTRHWFVCIHACIVLFQRTSEIITC